MGDRTLPVAMAHSIKCDFQEEFRRNEFYVILTNNECELTKS